MSADEEVTIAENSDSQPTADSSMVCDVSDDSASMAEVGSADDRKKSKVRKHPRRRKYCKRGLVVVGVLLIPVVYSYGRALTGPGSDSLQARSIEWAREHHLGAVVDRVEKYWYARHQAKLGGTPDSRAEQLVIKPAQTSVAPALPTSNPVVPAPSDSSGTVPGPAPKGAAGGVGAVTVPASAVSAESATIQRNTVPLNPPVSLVSPVQDQLPDEGRWNGIGPSSKGRYGAYATLIRPDAVHTSVLDAVVWIDPTMLSFRQYPGRKIPGAPWDRTDYIEPVRQTDLVAAFAGGFRLADSKGGMFLGGKTLSTLRAGAATFVIDQHGVADIGVWGRDFTTTDGFDSARQNLDLIVDGGVVAPQLATDPNRAWGFTGPANKDAVWRSGAGVTADGAFVWVGGDGLSIGALANTLLRAGAIRGMQLDINHEWVQFNTYAADATGTVHGSRLLAAMQHSDDRYLTEDTRDFIAVFNRTV